MPIDRVFVAGAGLMGHGIAQVLAATGKSVVLYEPQLDRAHGGHARIADNLERQVAKGRLTAEDRHALLGRVEPTSDLALVADADLAIEAIVENVQVKQALWRDLDRAAGASTIFASNTSSIPIRTLAAVVSGDRLSRFLGMHFFSPVPVMPLLELIRSDDTAQETLDVVRALAAELGKSVIVAADRPGFVVNRMLLPLLAEAMRALDEGLASADDIDAGVRLGLSHPMGPLELADFIGLDVCLDILRVLEEGISQERFQPPPVLERLVRMGHLGQKSGRGFHRYPPGDA